MVYPACAASVLLPTPAAPTSMTTIPRAIPHSAVATAEPGYWSTTRRRAPEAPSRRGPATTARPSPSFARPEALGRCSVSLAGERDRTGARDGGAGVGRGETFSQLYAPHT